MLTPGLFVWAKFVTVPGDAKDFEAVGKQWHWSYRLPGKDNKLGHSEVRYMTVDNPLGVDPDDPAGKDDIIDRGSDVSFARESARAGAAALDRRAA